MTDWGGQNDPKSGRDVANKDNNTGSSLDMSKGPVSQSNQHVASCSINFEAMANGILDKVTGQLFEEIANKVIEDDVGHWQGDVDGPLAVSVSPATMELPSAEVEHDASCVTPLQRQQPQTHVKDACFGPQKCSKSRPELQVAAAVCDDLEEETPTRRSSKRRANSLDEHSLARAQRLTAMRNLDAPKCTQHSASFLSMSDDHISSNISNLDVILGANDSLVKLATKQIRELEQGRIANSPKNKNQVKCDLSKDLDELEMQEDDGFDQMVLNEINSEVLEDCLARNNSHSGDICLLGSTKKSKASKSKPHEVPNKKKGTKITKKIKSIKRKESFGTAEVFMTWLNSNSCQILQRSKI